LLVVADGVGGWNNVGIDPSAYSRRLCELISKNFYEFQNNVSDSDATSSNMIQFNEDFVKNLIIKSVNQNQEKGSSTVCVLYMDNFNNTVYSGYLGDSCYLIARPRGIGDFEIIFKSKEQTHGFNIPFQVGSEGDDPKLAITYKHNVIKDDIVILATDGLWDNIEVENILQELNLFSNKINSIIINTIDFAKLLSQKAEEFSYKIDYFSPFARRALEHNKNYKKFRGGKPDDITVIVAQISEHINKDRDPEIPH
jgi:protein phosphatase PTC7